MIVIFSSTGNDILQERKTAPKRNLLSLDMKFIGLQFFAITTLKNMIENVLRFSALRTT